MNQSIFYLLQRGSLLCLSLLLGATALLAQETPADSTGLGRIEKTFVDSTAWLWRWQGRGSWQHLDTSLRVFISPREVPETQVWSLQAYAPSNLGSLGTPDYARTYRPNFQDKLGFRPLNFLPYESSRLHADRLPEYQTTGNRPLTDIRYSQITQRNNNLAINFAHQAKPNLYYAIFYDLVNYYGFYANQQLRLQNLGTHFRFSASKGRYQAQIGYFKQAVKQAENGGSRNDSLLGGLTSDLLPTQVEMWLGSEALSQWQSNQLFYQHSWQRDSSAKQSIAHRIVYQDNSQKFYDKSPDDAGSYYGAWQLNPRGLRHSMAWQSVGNRLSLNREIDASSQGQIYLEHEFFYWEQEPLAGKWLNQVGLGARFQNENLQAQGLVQWAQGLNASLQGHYRKGLLEAEGQLRYNQAPALAQQVFANQQSLWTADFQPTFEANLGLRVHLPFNLQVAAYYHQFQNYLYFNQDYAFAQKSGLLQLGQLELRVPLRLGNWHLDAKALLQYLPDSGANYLPLPLWQVQADLYWEAKAFKTMFLRIGTSINYWADYYAPGYFPVLGQYYVQQSRVLPGVPLWDVYLSAKIWKFRFFLKGEHLMQAVTGENYFINWRQPLPNAFLRFGLSWRLMD